MANTDYTFYNPETKSEYIIEKNSTTALPKYYLERLFSYVKSAEERLGKDICEFTVPEIKDMYITQDISSAESITVMNSHLALYTQYCCEKNLVPDCQNHFIEIKDFNQYISKGKFKDRIITRKQLLNYVSQLPNVSDAVVLLALFEGLKGENYIELTDLSIHDMNSNGVLNVGDRSILLSAELSNYIRESSEEYTYYSMTQKMERTIKLVDEFEGQVVKQQPNATSDDQFYKGRRIYNRIQRCIDYLGMNNIRGNSLAESGKIHMYNTLKMQNEMSEYQIAKEIGRTYNCRMVLKPFKDKYSEFLL